MTCWDQDNVGGNKLRHVEAEAWPALCPLGRGCFIKELFCQLGSQNEGPWVGEKGFATYVGCTVGV